MKTPRILYSSAEVHAQIKQLFSNPDPMDERVALVAYVGRDAMSYLPHPDGMRVICAPSAGGTDPDTLRLLMKRGAKLEFADRLHMKVYWSRNRGCVITSANASSNALGASGLKEVGAWLQPGAVTLERLIRYARPRPVRAKELRELDKAARIYHRRIGQRVTPVQKARDFLDWYTDPFRSTWKLGCCIGSVPGTAKAVSEQALAEYGQKVPHAWLSVRKAGIRENNWILAFTLDHEDARDFEWVYVDFLVRISPKEGRYFDKRTPYHAVQVKPASQYSTPFRITSAFWRAFGKAIQKVSTVRLRASQEYLPSARLLHLIASEMQARRL